MNIRSAGTFFPWPNQSENEGIVLRVLDWEAVQNLKKAKNEIERRCMALDFCIVGWTGVRDDSGNEIPCTPENKIILLNNNFEAAAFILERLDMLTKKNEATINALNNLDFSMRKKGDGVKRPANLRGRAKNPGARKPLSPSPPVRDRAHMRGRRELKTSGKPSPAYSQKTIFDFKGVKFFQRGKTCLEGRSWKGMRETKRISI